ncbi:hypothetical protein, partial [Burkholderia cepacia]|uniref:hypothetical protein n=1 Tax=Burkholderia cepacia TaxID=292 RepID=UPI001955232B
AQTGGFREEPIQSWTSVSPCVLGMQGCCSGKRNMRASINDRCAHSAEVAAHRARFGRSGRTGDGVDTVKPKPAVHKCSTSCCSPQQVARAGEGGRPLDPERGGAT